MSTFKIGDRVHCAHYNMTGRVVDFDSRSRVDSVGEILYDVEWDGPGGSRGGWSRTDDLLTLAPPRPAPRGPRPLPIRQRVVLTAGKTLRAPARDMWSRVYTLTGPRLRDGERSWFV